jgi:caffeoyl-CoA O-methyltransferase
MTSTRTQQNEMQRKTGGRAHCFMEMVAMDAEKYCAKHTTPMSPLLEEIADYSLNNTPYPSMLTGRVEGRFLQLITQLSGARKVIDIGTFTGYSALAMAEVLPPRGEVITIEHNPEHAAIAQGFFARSSFAAKISLRQGEALEILKTLPDSGVDLVFIDADKADYSAYYQEAMRIVTDGGFILADNALWYGRVLDPQDEDDRAIAAFNEEVNADSRVEKLLLPIRDGIYLIRKTPTS